MFDVWRHALIYLFTAVILSLFLWAVAGAIPAAIFFGILLTVRWLFHVHNLAKLGYWLGNAEERSVPEGEGPWEDIFARLNKMMREHRKERAKRASALHDLELATSALPEGVVSLDKTEHIEWCNPLAEMHLGIDSNRDIGQQITYLVRQPEFIEYLAAKNYAEPLLLRGVRQDDLVLSCKLVSYSGNKKLLVTRDVTRFEHVETMRRDFVANVSHELRTPLTVVNGFVETLQDMPNLENDMSRRGLHMMGEQTLRMTHLVGDLLTLSKLEDRLNVLKEEVVDIVAMLQGCYEIGLELSAGKHQLKLEISSEIKLLGCFEELRSAFGNLVSNAIRYTPPGGEILINWSVRNDGQPVFSVRDSGIGIPQQHIPRLTERFYRVDSSRSRETGGTGLGLAIVKHIANRHQAHLEIISEEGRGSTFSIVFPAARKQE